MGQGDPTASEAEARQWPGPDLSDLEVLVWNDQVHEVQEGEILHFWRLSFGPKYNLTAILASLERLYREVGISSHIAYETLGEFDLLLRLWVPRSRIAEQIENLLGKHLEDDDLWDAQDFVGHTYDHWASLGSLNARLDQPELATPGLVAPSITDALATSISEYNTEQFKEYRARYQGEFASQQHESRSAERPPGAEALLSPHDGSAELLSRISLATRGVRFYVTFDPPFRPFTLLQRNELAQHLRATNDQVRARWRERVRDLPCHISTYVGSGRMNSFVIMARAPHGHFHKFSRDLIAEYRAIPMLQNNRMRTYTHVIADQMFSEFTDTLSTPGTDFDDSAVYELENSRLEFKATFAVNLERFRRDGHLERDDRMIDGVVKSVCGMLNSPTGGTVVLGVLEVERMRNHGPEVLEWLAAGFGYEPESIRAKLGNTDERTLPNAVIGVSLEYEGGRPYTDADDYQGALEKTLISRLSNNPWIWSRMAWREVAGKAIIVISISPAFEWIYAEVSRTTEPQFFVREASATRAYTGREADIYKAHNARGRGA